MALITPTDRSLINVISAYEREIMGQKLTIAQINRIAESTKRLLLDEIHSAKHSRWFTSLEMHQIEGLAGKRTLAGLSLLELRAL